MLDTPLLDALRQSAAADRQAWHMPGHLAGCGFPEEFLNNLGKLDTTELPVTDDLNHPAGPARLAMSLAADAFGAGHTRFITSGATAALHIMLGAAVGRQGCLMVARACHQAILHAAALLDLQICFMEIPEPALHLIQDRGSSELPDCERGPAQRYSLIPQVSPNLVDRNLAEHPECRAVIITSPDYYGQCAELEAIAEIVHRRGALLLVDEAHGAHLSFGGSELPQSAMAAGADSCVQSGHKTLPVLTQGAYLHISKAAAIRRPQLADLIDTLLPVFQTSSPSFIIGASLDYARAMMSSCGARLIKKQLKATSELSAKMPDLLVVSSGGESMARPSRDPLRLVITSRSDKVLLPAQNLAAELQQAGYDIEFADLTRLVLLPSFFQNDEQWQKLADAINQAFLNVIKTMRGTNSSRRLLELESAWRIALSQAPQCVISPANALLSLHQTVAVDLDAAVGRIAARPVIPYPPGVPLIWPGERLDEKRLELISSLLDNKINITGVDQVKLAVIDD